MHQLKAFEREKDPIFGEPTSRWVARHQVGLWRYLRFLGCDPDLAEDLTQETLIAGLGEATADRLRPNGRWLRTTAHNLFCSHLRRRGRQPKMIDIELAETVFTESANGDQDGGEGYRIALRSCLEALSARGRRVLALRYGEGHSRAEIAKRLGIGVDGVKSQLRRLRTRLRRCIAQRIGSEFDL